MPAQNGDTHSALNFRANRAAWPVGYTDTAWGVYDDNGVETFPGFPSGKLTNLPATVDRGRYYRHDPIKASEDCGTMPTQGFRADSKSVNDCRLTATEKVKVRVPNKARPTAGNIEDADRNMPVTVGTARTAHKAGVAAKRNVKAGKRANKRAIEDRKRARVIAELRLRGYNV